MILGFNLHGLMKSIQIITGIMILAFSPKDNIAFSVCSGSKRKSVTEVLEIPSFYKGSEFHSWISFVSDDRMSISMSSYVGVITY